MTEYYTQKPMPVGDVFFVAGPDVAGPMGKARVPIAGRTAAEQFQKDHSGNRLLTADATKIEVL